MKRIQPRQLREPFSRAKIQQMVDSWRGQGLTKSQVPVEVRMIDWILRDTQAVHENAETQRRKRQAMQQTIESARATLDSWPQQAIENFQRNRRDEVLATVKYQPRADLAAAMKD